MRFEKRVGVLMVLVILISTVTPVMALKPSDTGRIKYESAKLALKMLMSDRKNAVTIFENLPPTVKRDVVELLKVKTIVTKIEGPDRLSVLSKSGYNSITMNVEGKNVLGMTLWKYTQKIDWHYDGSKITSKFRVRYASVYAPLWKFNGHIGNQEQGGEGHWSYRAWTQGEFSLCLGGDIGCIQHAYPWIDMTIYGDGDWIGSKGW